MKNIKERCDLVLKRIDFVKEREEAVMKTIKDETSRIENVKRLKENVREKH
ncbi:MAG: hypothetical protein HY840_01355 [Bacteroidetes bacterium]|nr:hypothetical protein [Bacteroidota bacterium]